jgi:hypothetical protein
MTDEVLASWNDGPAKRAILAFVEGVTTAGPAFVAPADRIATFDNDGTLWVEQPAPRQFDFIFGTWAKEVEADPSLASRQPEPFDAFPVHPASVAIYHLGNNGAARTELKAWALPDQLSRARGPRA